MDSNRIIMATSILLGLVFGVMLAAALTLWTGWGYARAAHKGLA